MMVDVNFTLNGRVMLASVEPRCNLADLLREQFHLTATHLGCEHGVCGACTVLIDGELARSCIALAVSLEGADVRTLEGMSEDPRMNIIKEAFHEEHGLQCGFCTPGMLITIWDILDRTPRCTETELRHALSGNLCRCTGYQGIVRSAMRAAEQLNEYIEAPEE